MNRIPIVSLIDYTKKELREALGEKAVEFLNWEDFCWIKQKSNRPVKHPEWPNNFIKAVRHLVYETEGLSEYKDLKYIFLNAGGEILKKIIANKIPVIIVMPRKFEGKYTPVEHYQELNKKYLELDMPMVYLENEEEFIKVFSRESTYKYLKDKTEFVEGFRFGTCDFIEDIEEMAAMYEKAESSIKACEDIANEKFNIVGPFALVRDDELDIIDKNSFMEVLEAVTGLLAIYPDHEFVIKDIGNSDNIICKVGLGSNGSVMLRHPNAGN